MRFAERDHRCNRSVSSDSVGQKLSKTGLLKSFIGEERHHLHAVLARQCVHSLIEGAPHYSEAVDYVDLRTEYSDLIDMLDQAVITVFSIDVIEKALAGVLRTRASGRE